MRYIVMIGIHKFEMPDGQTALNFAELAKKYHVPTEYHSKLDPTLTIKEEGEDNE